MIGWRKADELKEDKWEKDSEKEEEEESNDDEVKK